MELLEYIKKPAKYLPEGILKLKEEPMNRLYIYGTDTIENTSKTLSEFNIEIAGIIKKTKEDEYSQLHNNYFVYSFDEIENKGEKISVIVSFYWSKNADLLRQLCDSNIINRIYILEGAEYAWNLMYNPEKRLFKHEKMCFIDSYYKGLIKRKLNYQYMYDNINLFQQTYNWMTDKNSKRTMINYLNGHVNLKTFPMESTKDIYPQYFTKDIIKFIDDEVFLDCGAYDGDTIRSFYNQTNAKYKKIYAFEPDKKMITVLSNNIQNIPNCLLMQIGVYSEDKKIGFNNAGCGTITSFPTDDETDCIQVAKIDNVISDKVTFIKMDIEGSELAALMGAAQTIKKYKPKLAICVYHKAEDLISIPQYIKSLVPEYKLYLRGYFDYASEVVLYAVV